MGLSKFNEDGFRDTNFAPPIAGTVTQIVPWPEGGWVVGGLISATNGVLRQGVIKIHPEGTVDANYSASLQGISSVNGMVLDEQRRLLVGGTFTAGVYTNLVRFRSDGNIDSGWARNEVTGIEGTVRSVALQNPGQKPVVAARTRRSGQVRYLNRFSSEGLPDLSFADHVSCEAGTLAVQTDGKILWAPLESFCGGGPERIDANGIVDESWSGPYFSQVSAISVVANGDILITGVLEPANFFRPAIYGLARVRAEEQWSLLVRSSSELADFRVGWIGSAVQALNGDVLASIQFGRPNSGVFDSLSDGIARVKAGRFNFDPTSLSMVTRWLDWPGGPRPFFTDLALQADGRVIVAGAFDSIGGVARLNLARLHPDGKQDSSFALPPTMNGGILTLYPLASGQFLVGGWFSQIAGRNQGGLARFHGDGRFDETFMSGLSGVAGSSVPTVSGLAVQPGDQKILAGGTFTTVHGNPRPYLARFHPDGRLDADFLSSPGAGPNAVVGRVVVQSDGRILIGGGFSRVGDLSRNLLARLWPDGRVDQTFDAAIGTNFQSPQINAIELLPDGRILVGGRFSAVNGTGPSNLARLNPDGSLDSSFQVSLSGLDAGVNFVEVQPDGKYFVGGSFEHVNESEYAGLVRLHSDGTVDPFGSFCRSGPSRCWQGRLQSDGRLLVIDLDRPLELSRVLGDAPPGFTRPLSNQLIAAGASADLRVTTYSTAPVRYQWFVDDVPVVGSNQTNTWQLGRVDYDASIRVTVSNYFGASATSRSDVNVFYETAREIPSLPGSAVERLPGDGPEVEPLGAANWIAGRLIAVDPGPISVRWRDAAGNPMIGTARIVGRLAAGYRFDAGLNLVDAREEDGRYGDRFSVAGELDGEHRVYFRALGGWAGRIALRGGSSGPVLTTADAGEEAITISFTNRPVTNLNLTVTSVETNQVGRYQVGLYPVLRPRLSMIGAVELGDAWSATRSAAVGQGRWYHDDYVLAGVQPGDRVTVRVTSAAFIPFIEIRLLADESVIQFTDGSNLELTVQGAAGRARDYLVRVTTRESEARGTYLVAVDQQGLSPVIKDFVPTAGTPGTRVTVRGGNFLDGPQPLFDGVSIGGVGAPSFAPVVRGGEQEFELIVPSDARTGALRLHRLQNILATSTNDFTVLAPIGGVRRESGDQLSFAITNLTAGTIVVESATNLNPPVVWRELRTNATPGSVYWKYTNDLNRADLERFFRAKIQ